MKVAIIHDSLMEFGGAERVLQTLLKIFPDSDVYTSCANFDLVRTFFPAFSLLKLHLSWVQYTPFRSHNSLLQSLSPLIWKRFNFSGYDFIIVSRLDKCKNIELAIKACNVLKAPLKIVGRSVYQKYELFLRSIANSNVEFLGMKSDEEIAKLYESAIGFIFTAKNEDFGIAPVEAMAYGVPVIAHYSGGLKEVLLEGKTGL